MKIVLKRLNDNYQHYFTDVSTMHAKRIKKLQLLTLRIEHQFFSYISQFVTIILKATMMELDQLLIKMSKICEKFRCFNRDMQKSSLTQGMRETLDIIRNDYDSTFDDLNRLKKIRILSDEHDKLLEFWINLFPHTELMFDEVSWNDFVECVHTNKLFQSFDKAKMLYIVSRNYDTLTLPTLLRIFDNYLFIATNLPYFSLKNLKFPNQTGSFNNVVNPTFNKNAIYLPSANGNGSNNSNNNSSISDINSNDNMSSRKDSDNNSEPTELFTLKSIFGGSSSDMSSSKTNKDTKHSKHNQNKTKEMKEMKKMRTIKSQKENEFEMINMKSFENTFGTISNYDFTNDQLYSIPYVPLFISDFLIYQQWNDTKQNDFDKNFDMSSFNKCIVYVWTFSTHIKVNHENDSVDNDNENENQNDHWCELKYQWFDPVVAWVCKGQLTTIVFCHAINTLIVGGISGYVCLFDMGGHCYNLFCAHTDAVSKMLSIDDTYQLVTCSLDGTIKIWNLNHFKYPKSQLQSESKNKTQSQQDAPSSYENLLLRILNTEKNDR